MDIIALAAGYGTRLGELTFNTPKALLNISGKPLLSYTLEKINALQGVGTIYIVSNAKFYDQFRAWEKTVQSKYPIKILNDGTQTKEERLEIVGDLHFAIKTQNIKDDVLIIGADNFFTCNFNELISLAKNKQSSAAGFFDVKSIEAAKNFGVAVLEDNIVKNIHEKPQNPQSTLIVMMLWYVVAKDLCLLSQLVDANRRNHNNPSLPAHIVKHSTLYAVTYDQPWFDVGRVEDYNKVSAFTAKTKRLL